MFSFGARVAQQAVAGPEGQERAEKNPESAATDGRGRGEEGRHAKRREAGAGRRADEIERAEARPTLRAQKFTVIVSETFRGVM